MGKPRWQAIGPLIPLSVLWFAHHELLYVCARQGLVEKAIGGGGGVALGEVMTAMGFIVVRVMLYLLGPGLGLLALRYLIWPVPVRSTTPST